MHHARWLAVLPISGFLFYLFISVPGWRISAAGLLSGVLSWLGSLYFQIPAASHIPQQGAHKVATAVSSSGSGPRPFCSTGRRGFLPPRQKCLQPLWEWWSISLLLHWHRGCFVQNYWHYFSLWKRLLLLLDLVGGRQGCPGMFILDIVRHLPQS